MGFFGKIWSKAKSIAKSAIAKVIEWGGAVVRQVERTWESTKRAVRAAAEWVVEKVEAIAGWVKRLGQKVAKLVREIFRIGPEYEEEDVVREIVATLQAIVAAAEAATSPDALTEFGPYLDATAALRMARAWLAQLSDSRVLGDVNEEALRAISALRDLLVSGTGDAMTVECLDAYCASLMESKGGSFRAFGAETLEHAWVKEAEQRELEIREQAVEIAELDVLESTAAAIGDTATAAAHRTDRLRREQLVKDELRPRVADLHLASRVLEGFICVETGEEDDRFLVRDAERAGAILMHWQLGASLAAAETEFLTRFAASYISRATRRAAKVAKSMATPGPEVSVG